MGDQSGRNRNDHELCFEKISGGNYEMSKILIIEDEEAIADLEKDNQIIIFIECFFKAHISSVCYLYFKSGKFQIILLQICNCFQK